MLNYTFVLYLFLHYTKLRNEHLKIISRINYNNIVDYISELVSIVSNEKLLTLLM